LIFHGDNDQIVPFENAVELEKNALPPKQLVCQKNGDHQMSNEAHQQAFMNQAMAWFKTYF